MSHRLSLRTKTSPTRRTRSRRAALAGCLAALIVATSSWAQGSDIAIHRDGCRSGVHLEARDAHLSSVLGSLAKALNFRLDFESDSDPLITIDEFLHGEDMLPRLADAQNFTVAHAPDPACPLHPRIVGVWVLPRSGVRAASVVAPPAAPSATASLSEQERREQEGINMYLKAHGFTAPETPSAH